MREQEFMGKFIMGTDFYHPVYGKVKAVRLPNNVGEVKVYSSAALREVSVNISDLNKNVNYEEDNNPRNIKTL